jgi:hypothetical protein
VILLGSGVVTARGESSRLLVEPGKANLTGPLERLQLLVTTDDDRGQPIDQTHKAKYTSLTPDIAAVNDAGVVVPLSEGTARIEVQYGGKSATVVVDVVLHGEAAAASFLDHVEPILSKAGCNMGACHASQFGKGGFKLSVFGFDAHADHAAIARESGQRRISPLRADDSLILKKATMQIGHGGNKRFSKGDYPYEVLQTWVSAGAPRPRLTEPDITGLTISPATRRYQLGHQQQLRVVAHYRDGQTKDVTERSRFDSLDDGVVTVTSSGQLTVAGRGLSAIMVRYRGQVGVGHVISPYAVDVDLADFRPANFIDEKVRDQWQRLALRPSSTCTDAEFIRRAFLDCLGTLPSPERVDSFLQSRDVNKRATLVDEILGLPGDPARKSYVAEYSAYWTLKFGDLLRNNRKTTGDSGMWALHNWLRQSFRANLPLDQLARELITAQGSIFEHGPANFVAYAPTSTDPVGVASPTDLAETTAQVFLGVRLQCARCHNHPFEAYSQQDYYGLAAFFTGLDSKSSNAFGELGFDSVISLKPVTPIRLPSTGEVVSPKLLLAGRIDVTNNPDPRQPLADWLLEPNRRLFARCMVNRVWGDVMGVGLVDPVDDLRSTNPASNPELLEALAVRFVEQKYDLRQLLRDILNSRVYQLSATPRSENLNHTRFYTHYNAKRLSAEVLLDAIDSACATHEKFPGIPLGTRAVDLPDSNFESYFLDTLGRPQRLTFCACERTAQPNLAQILHLANGNLLQRKLTAPAGRIQSLLKRGVDDRAAVRELYLVTFSRPPTDEESVGSLQVIKHSESRRTGLETVLWALCNSREFLLNH